MDAHRPCFWKEFKKNGIFAVSAPTVLVSFVPPNASMTLYETSFAAIVMVWNPFSTIMLVLAVPCGLRATRASTPALDQRPLVPFWETNKYLNGLWLANMLAGSVAVCGTTFSSTVL